MNARRGPVLVFLGCAAAVTAAMAWITRDVLAFERSDAESRARAAHHETLRLALWRMDSWLAPMLAAETEPHAAAAPSGLVRAEFTIRADGRIRPVRGGDTETELACRAVGIPENVRRIEEAEALANELATNGGAALQGSGGWNSGGWNNGGPRDAAVQQSAAGPASPAPSETPAPAPPPAPPPAAGPDLGDVQQKLKDYVSRGKSGRWVQSADNSGARNRSDTRTTPPAESGAGRDGPVAGGGAVTAGGSGTAPGPSPGSVPPPSPGTVPGRPDGTGPGGPRPAAQDGGRSVSEAAPAQAARSVQTFQSTQFEVATPDVVSAPALGPLAAVWVKVGANARELVVVRRVLGASGDPGSGAPATRAPEGAPSSPRAAVAAPGGASLFVLDWDAVRTGLREQVADLLPDVDLRPLESPLGVAAQGFVLASVPVAVDAPPPAPRPIPHITPTRTTLGVAWLAFAASLAAVGLAVRRTVDLSERRRRFASSVTHELRTPLTTFRLYSEMLADDMVTDPARRREYMETLKSESARLAHLVENVLSYARVEEGRMAVRRERIAVADLLLRVTPPLDRRAREAGATLVVHAGDAPSTAVDVDPDLAGQILFNLVDNACKYAAQAADRRIEVEAGRRGGRVSISVRDHGPGLPAGREAEAFAPFERAGRAAGDVVPGIGLGLALSRALARDLGGDLVYEPAPGGGARFVLSCFGDGP